MFAVVVGPFKLEELGSDLYRWTWLLGDCCSMMEWKGVSWVKVNCNEARVCVLTMMVMTSLVIFGLLRLKVGLENEC